MLQLNNKKIRISEYSAETELSIAVGKKVTNCSCNRST